MAIYAKGDRVFAIKDIGRGWSATVKKGTKGTVVGVEEPWFGSDKFTVRFDNDVIEEITEKHLRRRAMMSRLLHISAR